MTTLSPFRGVAVAVVARAVGTPGAQQVGRSLPARYAETARVACHCRHPATRRRRFRVPPCSAALPWAGRWPEHQRRRFGGSSSAVSLAAEPRNTGTLLPRPLVGLSSARAGRTAPCLSVAPFVASAEVFADGDFNLGGRGIRDFRGRVVSRPRPFSNYFGHAPGYLLRRFTGSLAPLANTCAGYLAVIFSGLFCLTRGSI